MAVHRPAGGQGAHCAAAHAQDAQGVVVHGDGRAGGSVLVQSHDLGSGLDDLLTSKVLQQVHLVDAQVGQSAHGGLLLVEEPGAPGLHGPVLRAGVAHGGPEGDDVADDARVQQLLGLPVHRVEAHVVADHQVLAVALGGGHHGLALRQGHSHGLFAQDVLPGVQGVGGDLRMAAVLHADGHGVDAGVVEQVKIGIVDLAAVLGGHLLGTLGVQIVVARQLHMGVGGIFRQMAHLRDLAAADDTDSDHNDSSYP